MVVSALSVSCQRAESERGTLVSLKDECLQTMLELCDALVRLQNGDNSSPDFGAIRCPECGVLHTRASEALYPFAVAYEHTSNEAYLRAAVDGEGMHMPVLEDEIFALTPRIEYSDGLGYFTNLFERDGRIAAHSIAARMCSTKRGSE